jgi:hypothetical protein
VPRTEKDLDAWLHDHVAVSFETLLQVMILGQKHRRLMYYLDSEEAEQRIVLEKASAIPPQSFLVTVFKAWACARSAFSST